MWGFSSLGYWEVSTWWCLISQSLKKVTQRTSGIWVLLAAMHCWSRAPGKLQHPGTVEPPYSGRVWGWRSDLIRTREKILFFSVSPSPPTVSAWHCASSSEKSSKKAQIHYYRAGKRGELELWGNKLIISTIFLLSIEIIITFCCLNSRIKWWLSVLTIEQQQKTERFPIFISPDKAYSVKWQNEKLMWFWFEEI